MNEIAEIADVVLSPEAITLVAGMAASGAGAPVIIGGAVVAGLAALFLPKEKSKAVMNTLRGLLGRKSK